MASSGQPEDQNNVHAVPTQSTAATAQRARPQAAEGPFEGYRSSGQSGYSGGEYGGYSSGYPSQPQSTHSTTGGTAAAPVRRGSNNTALATLVGLVAVAALALMGYLIFRHNGSAPEAKGSGAPTVSASSGASSAPSSGQPVPSSSSDGAAPSVASSDGGAAPAPSASSSAAQQPAPAQPAPSSSDAGTASSTGIDSLPNLISRYSDGGTEYAITRQGDSISIYQADGSQPQELSTISLPGKGGQVSFLSLSGCSKPLVLFNADKGSSAAYGWNNGQYQAFRGSSDGSMTPDGGNGKGFKTYGVNATKDGKLEYRDTSKQHRGQGNQFDSCERSDPDVLHKSN